MVRRACGETEVKISIVTPTIQRDSLCRCCESVDVQSYSEWEHIVMVDSEVANYDLWDKVEHENRRVLWCVEPHRNFGNTCRHNAWLYTTGDWIIHLDDDNYLADPHILGDLAVTLSTIPYWAIFPILRHGYRFFYDPPGNCYVDTANMVIRREIAQWPDGPEYTMDGLFCEELKSKYSYVTFPDFRPIVVMEVSNRGE